MRLSRPLAGLCLALTLLASVSTQAQTDRFPDLWVTDLRVEGMALLGDTVFVAGRFRQLGPPTGQLAVLDKMTGQADPTYPTVNGLTSLTSGSVQAVLPDGVGGYYVGGDLIVVEGAEQYDNLVHVRADGTLDAGFRPNPGTAGQDRFVAALALDRTAASPSGAGVLYAGGRFDTVGGQPREDLAAIDAATGVVLSLQADFVQASSFGDVESLVVSDGVVYVGGRFSAIGGQLRTGLAALDGRTGSILPWAPVLTVSRPFPYPYASRLALGDSTVYVGGVFETIAGQPRPGLAEVTLAGPGGGAPTAWTPSTGLGGFVVIGDFLWGQPSGSALGRVSRATGALQTFPAGVSRVQSLAYDPVGGTSGAGTLYVGAQRPTPANSSVIYPVVVGVDPATGLPTGFEAPGATEGNRVNALAVEPGPGGRLFVGGNFITFGAGITPRQGLAAFYLTTGRPTPFAAGVTGPGQGLFEDLALSLDGRFLYGYSTVAGGAALRLTEFEIATGATREFIPQGLTAATYGASAHVAGAYAQTAGARSTATAAANPRVENATSALVVTDTRLCLSLSGVACYDRATAALLFYTPMVYVGTISENNGDLLYLPSGGPVQGPGAGGTLYLAAPVAEAPPGTSRPALVAVDAETGAILEQWTPGFAFAGAEGYALALLDSDGLGPARTALYAGGDREWTVQGADRRGLAAFDPLTAALSPWAPTVSGGPVLTMAAHNAAGAGGVVYAGGSFRFIGNVIVPTSTAAFDAVTGAYLTAWNPGTGVSFVSLVSARHDAVFLGGNFGDSPRGSGHAGLTGVSPARPILPTAGEADAPEVPRAASLLLAGPNPFRSRTALALALPEAQTVEASLYDVLGRRVSVLHAGMLPAGESRIEVDASVLPAGVYVARVSGPGVAASVTLTVVR